MKRREEDRRQTLCDAVIFTSKEPEPVNENETIENQVYGAMTTVCASARLL